MISYMSRDDRVRGVENTLGYRFVNPSHPDEALHLAGSGGRPGGNKSMAQVGDAVIRMILTMDGHQRGLCPGGVDRELQLRATDKKLAEVGTDKSIDDFIYKNPSQFGLPISAKLMATTLEALIGAVWLDSQCDTKAVEQVMLELGILSPPAV